MKVQIFAALAYASVSASLFAQAPVEGQNLGAEWVFKPNFEDGDTITAKYSGNQLGKLIPRSFVIVDDDMAIGKGKLLAKAGTPLIQMSQRATFCEPKRKAGSHDVTCFVDVDSDGRLDSFFRHSPASDMTEVVKVGKIKPLSAAAGFTPQPDGTDTVYFDVSLNLGRSRLSYSEAFITEKFCIQGGRLPFLNGIYGSTRENCTYESSIKLSEAPPYFVMFGFSFVVLEAKEDEVILKVNGRKL